VAEDDRLDAQGETPRLPKVDWLFVFASAAFNLIRLPKLLPRTAWSAEVSPLGPP
jgi:hypothetical protein